jgi:ParB family chromosome partitioning protein
LPLLNLPEDVLQVLRQGQLEYTKARAIARIKDEQQRVEVLTEAIAHNLSLSDIRQRVKEVQVSEPTPEVAFAERYAELGKRLKKSEIWHNTRKRKRLERLLGDLEQLIAED